MNKLYETCQVVDVNITTGGLKGVCQDILKWISAGMGSSKYVCLVNTHSVVEAHANKQMKVALRSADFCLADSRILYWICRLKRYGCEHIRGIDLTRSLLAMSLRNKVPIGFYGSSEGVLNGLVKVVETEYPGIDIRCNISPPYRPLTEEEQLSMIEEIGESGVKLLFVGLGCPKQEKWMYESSSSLNCVMVGVGAVFDFLVDPSKEAHQFVVYLGLEWMFRLLKEPRRLTKRYLTTIPVFIWLAITH